ncbi:hypothetical protein G6L37_03420 [Agrobacterium rubi]|nr:hypothetical protein [Agrobacterium rubi]NTF24421.1 hypothetical protein [Agrobacterium rubi]
MTFEEWYNSHEWFHDPDLDMKTSWDALIAKGFSSEEAAELLDRVISAIRNEYGD